MNSLENNGKCFICNGEIINATNKKEGNKTIIIRKAGSNNYWASSKIKKSSEWKKYLEGTEIDAHPGLRSKLHKRVLYAMLQQKRRMELF